MMIEPDIAPETVWEPIIASQVPVVDPWLDEDLHSFR
jgi:hypothetical protein